MPFELSSPQKTDFPFSYVGVASGNGGKKKRQFNELSRFFQFFLAIKAGGYYFAISLERGQVGITPTSRGPRNEELQNDK